MMKRLIFALALVVFTAWLCAPAHADRNGGSIRHYDPDAGRNSLFIVSCAGDSDSYRGVREGQHSDDVCPSEDVNFVYVRTGEQIACKVFQKFEVKWDATGWHKVGNYSNYLCVTQVD